MADMKELLEYIADLRQALPLNDLLKEELDAIRIGDMTIGYCPFEDVDRGLSGTAEKNRSGKVSA